MSGSSTPDLGTCWPPRGCSNRRVRTTSCLRSSTSSCNCMRCSGSRCIRIRSSSNCLSIQSRKDRLQDGGQTGPTIHDGCEGGRCCCLTEAAAPLVLALDTSDTPACAASAVRAGAAAATLCSLTAAAASAAVVTSRRCAGPASAAAATSRRFAGAAAASVAPLSSPGTAAAAASASLLCFLQRHACLSRRPISSLRQLLPSCSSSSTAVPRCCSCGGPPELLTTRQATQTFSCSPQLSSPCSFMAFPSSAHFRRSPAAFASFVASSCGTAWSAGVAAFTAAAVAADSSINCHRVSLQRGWLPSAGFLASLRGRNDSAASSAASLPPGLATRCTHQRLGRTARGVLPCPAVAFPPAAAGSHAGSRVGAALAATAAAAPVTRSAATVTGPLLAAGSARCFVAASAGAAAAAHVQRRGCLTKVSQPQQQEGAAEQQKPAASLLQDMHALSLDETLNIVAKKVREKRFVSFAHEHLPRHPASSTALTPGELIVCLHRVAAAAEREAAAAAAHAAAAEETADATAAGDGTEAPAAALDRTAGTAARPPAEEAAAKRRAVQGPEAHAEASAAPAARAGETEQPEGEGAAAAAGAGKETSGAAEADMPLVRRLQADSRFLVLMKTIKQRLLCMHGPDLYRLLIAFARLKFCPENILIPLLSLLASSFPPPHISAAVPPAVTTTQEAPAASLHSSRSSSSRSSSSFSSAKGDSSLDRSQLCNIPLLLCPIIGTESSAASHAAAVKSFLDTFSALFLPATSLSSHNQANAACLASAATATASPSATATASSSAAAPTAAAAAGCSASPHAAAATAGGETDADVAASEATRQTFLQSLSLKEISACLLGMSTLGYRNPALLHCLADSVSERLTACAERPWFRGSRAAAAAAGETTRGTTATTAEAEEDVDSSADAAEAVAAAAAAAALPPHLQVQQMQQVLPLVTLLSSFSSLSVAHPQLYARLLLALRPALVLLPPHYLADVALALATLTRRSEFSFPLVFVAALESALAARCLVMEEESAALAAWSCCCLQLHRSNPLLLVGLLSQVLLHAHANRTRHRPSFLTLPETTRMQLQQVALDMALDNTAAGRTVFAALKKEKELWHALGEISAPLLAAAAAEAGNEAAGGQTEAAARSRIAAENEEAGGAGEWRLGTEAAEQAENALNENLVVESGAQGEALQHAEQQIWSLLENEPQSAVALFQAARTSVRASSQEAGEQLFTENDHQAPERKQRHQQQHEQQPHEQLHEREPQQQQRREAQQSTDPAFPRVAEEASAVEMQRGGVVAGFYRCSLLLKERGVQTTSAAAEGGAVPRKAAPNSLDASSSREDRLQAPERGRTLSVQRSSLEIPSQEKPEGPFFGRTKIIVVVDATTFNDDPESPDVFLSFKHKHLRLLGYHLVVVRLADWQQQAGTDEQLQYLIQHLVPPLQRNV